MDELSQFVNVATKIGWPATLAWLLYKQGIIKLPYLKNGNGNGNGTKKELERLGEYYNHTLTEKLDKLGEKMDEHMQIERENNFYMKRMLEEIKNL